MLQNSTSIALRSHIFIPKIIYLRATILASQVYPLKGYGRALRLYTVYDGRWYSRWRHTHRLPR
jgi:hypothetical protein